MKLALFDNYRLGVVSATPRSRIDHAHEDHDMWIVDVTDGLPWPHDPDPLTAGWWRALCRDFEVIQPDLEKAAITGEPVRLDQVTLRAPALGPSKIIAAASNYRDHVAEMHAVQERTLGHVEAWMMEFDVFLKAPSSIVGPDSVIVLPRDVVAAGHEVHHESELVVVIGTGGKDIPVGEALSHVLGYTAGLDITVRSPADRSRRKSYDTFSPLGPWITTRDEAGDGSGLEILLTAEQREQSMGATGTVGTTPSNATKQLDGVDAAVRQHVNTDDLITPVSTLVAYASSVMTLMPGDLLFTGAPPGVGPIGAGEQLNISISRIGEMSVSVA